MGIIKYLIAIILCCLSFNFALAQDVADLNGDYTVAESWSVTLKIGNGTSVTNKSYTGRETGTLTITNGTYEQIDHTGASGTGSTRTILIDYDGNPYYIEGSYPLTAIFDIGSKLYAEIKLTFFVIKVPLPSDLGFSMGDHIQSRIFETTGTSLASLTGSGCYVDVNAPEPTRGYLNEIDASSTASISVPPTPPPTPPATSGSVGTQTTMAGPGFGNKKGKILIGGASTKILNWTDASVTYEIKKPLAPMTYNLVLQLKEPKGASPITYPGVFTIMAPEITLVNPTAAGVGAPITISGNYFGAKKGKVYLEANGKIKNCKVTSWTMNQTDGTSQIAFVVPKLDPGNYQLYVSNKVGTTTPGVLFHVE